MSKLYESVDYNNLKFEYVDPTKIVRNSKHLYCLRTGCIQFSQQGLFGAVTLTKIADIDKYGYSGYGIGFERRSSFCFPGGGFGQTVLIFGADMSSSAHIDNKKKRHISSRRRTNARIRIYTDCRKNVFN